MDSPKHTLLFCVLATLFAFSYGKPAPSNFYNYGGPGAQTYNQGGYSPPPAQPMAPPNNQNWYQQQQQQQQQQQTQAQPPYGHSSDYRERNASLGGATEALFQAPGKVLMATGGVVGALTEPVHSINRALQKHAEKIPVFGTVFGLAGNMVDLVTGAPKAVLTDAGQSYSNVVTAGFQATGLNNNHHQPSPQQQQQQMAQPQMAQQQMAQYPPQTPQYGWQGHQQSYQQPGTTPPGQGSYYNGSQPPPTTQGSFYYGPQGQGTNGAPSGQSPYGVFQGQSPYGGPPGSAPYPAGANNSQQQPPPGYY